MPRAWSPDSSADGGTPRSSSAATVMSPAIPAVIASTKRVLPLRAPRSRSAFLEPATHSLASEDFSWVCPWVCS